MKTIEYCDFVLYEDYAEIVEIHDEFSVYNLPGIGLVKVVNEF